MIACTRLLFAFFFGPALGRAGQRGGDRRHTGAGGPMLNIKNTQEGTQEAAGAIKTKNPSTATIHTSASLVAASEALADTNRKPAEAGLEACTA